MSVDGYVATSPPVYLHVIKAKLTLFVNLISGAKTTGKGKGFRGKRLTPIINIDIMIGYCILGMLHLSCGDVWDTGNILEGK
jgi:hypothetical protein